MAMAMVVAIFRATWMEKNDGGKGNDNIGGNRTLANPCREKKHGRQIQWQLGNTRGNERTSVHCG